MKEKKKPSQTQNTYTHWIHFFFEATCSNAHHITTTIYVCTSERSIEAGEVARSFPLLLQISLSSPEIHVGRSSVRRYGPLLAAAVHLEALCKQVTVVAERQRCHSSTMCLLCRATRPRQHRSPSFKVRLLCRENIIKNII